MAEPFRVLIIDDEAPARSKIRRFLAPDGRFLAAGEAADGTEALAAVQRLRPELLILDIQMPGLTGFEVVENLEEPKPQVIFATAYDQFALRAFEAHALDYLLKPFDQSRFARALDKAWAQLQAGRSPAADSRLQAMLSQRPMDRLVVKQDDHWIPLPLPSILRISAHGKQVRIHTDQGPFLANWTLQELEDRLHGHGFARVHRSEIVALEAVVQMEPWDHSDALLILKDASHVVLSRTYHRRFLERWGLRT
jgi:two-component system LytT family response regulator